MKKKLFLAIILCLVAVLTLTSSIFVTMAYRERNEITTDFEHSSNLMAEFINTGRNSLNGAG